MNMSAFSQRQHCMDKRISAKCLSYLNGRLYRPNATTKYTSSKISSTKDLSQFSMEGKMDYLFNQPMRLGKYEKPKPSTCKPPQNVDDMKKTYVLEEEDDKLNTLRPQRNYMDSNMSALKHLLQMDERKNVANSGAEGARRNTNAWAEEDTIELTDKNANALGDNYVNSAYDKFDNSNRNTSSSEQQRTYSTRYTGTRDCVVREAYPRYENKTRDDSNKRYVSGTSNDSPLQQEYTGSNRLNSAVARAHEHKVRGGETASRRMNYELRNNSAPGRRYDCQALHRVNERERNGSHSGQRQECECANPGAPGQTHIYEQKKDNVCRERSCYDRNAVTSRRVDAEHRTPRAAGSRAAYNAETVRDKPGVLYEHKDLNFANAYSRYAYNARNNNAQGQRYRFEERTAVPSGLRRNHICRDATPSGQHDSHQVRYASGLGQCNYDQERVATASGRRQDDLGEEIDAPLHYLPKCRPSELKRMDTIDVLTFKDVGDQNSNSSRRFYAQNESQNAEINARNTASPAADILVLDTGKNNDPTQQTPYHHQVDGSQRFGDRRFSNVHRYTANKVQHDRQETSAGRVGVHENAREAEIRATSSAMSQQQEGRVATPGSMGRQQDRRLATPGAMGRSQDGRLATPGAIGRSQDGRLATPGAMGRSQDGRLGTPGAMGRPQDGRLATPGAMVRPADIRAGTPNVGIDRRQAKPDAVSRRVGTPGAVGREHDKSESTPSCSARQLATREATQNVLGQPVHRSEGSPIGQQIEKRETTLNIIGQPMERRQTTPIGRQSERREATPNILGQPMEKRQATPVGRQSEVRQATPNFQQQERTSTPGAAGRIVEGREANPSVQGRQQEELAYNNLGWPHDELERRHPQIGSLTYRKKDMDENYSARRGDTRGREEETRRGTPSSPCRREDMFGNRGGFSSTGKNVAFLAEIGRHVTKNVPIQYRKAIFDVGGDLNTSSGVFVAPYHGVYVFSYQVFPTFTGEYHVDLYKNGSIVARMRCENMKVGPSESSAVTEHAKGGDRYWLQVSKGGELHSGPHSFFSATLVSADYE